MLDPQKLAPRREQKREELFTERYERLLAWALRLTNQHRPSAEDLVQDAFIQFVLGRTNLEEIENIDGYLRRMLRYMHLSRISRNAEKMLDRTISITDYDSFDQSWRATEPARRMQAKEELCQICAYASSRKETSRAGVVLILRFFHNYYPSEIAQVLRSSRHCVDQWQRVARSELKLYMTERGGLRLMSTKLSPEPRQTEPSGWDGDVSGELRQMIFNSRKGECPPLEQLQEFYQSSNTETLTTAKLGHIVSCRLCLDAVNRLLNLPLLAERCQNEQGPPGTPPQDKNGGGPSGGGTIDLRSRYQQRLREVSEHKPKELRIAVNGSLVSSLKVSSEECELDLNLPQQESVEFVEVFSEQGVRLLFLSVGETDSRNTQRNTQEWAAIELSEGRTLEACLRFENGRALQVKYNEPLLADALAQTPLKLVKDEISVAPAAASSGDSENGNSSSWLSPLFRLVRWQKRAVPHAVKPEETVETSRSSVPETTRANHYASSQVSLLGVAIPAIRKPLWARPEWLAAVVSSIVIVGGFLFFRTSTTPTLTATNLLERASVGEKMVWNSPDQITHRIIDLEERRSAGGAVVSRRRIESWQNSAQGDRAERVYDESNRMIAGAWQKADGSRTVYHHGGRPRPEMAPAGTDSLLLNLDEIWQLELSAKEFSQLIAGEVQPQVEESTDSYLITYGTGRTIGASHLLKATMKLSRAGLHPIEQALLIERGGEVREYRFVETGFERLPQKDVAPTVFQVEPELLSENRKNEGGRVKQPVDLFHPSSFIPHPAAVASAELEVDVAYLLNQAKGDRSEQVSLSRTATGLLRVEGVVDTEQRKDELVRALAPVSNNPAVKIEISTIGEPMPRQPRTSSGAVTVREAEETASTVAVDNELRDYLSRKDATLKTGNDLDEAVRSFSSRMVNRGYRALFHAIELKRLINRFANVDMRTVTPDARAKWLQMLREHAAAFERETAALLQDIEPVFFSSSPSVAAEEIEIAGDVDLARAVERLHKLALVNNDAIRAGFTISAQSSQAVKSLQFWRSLCSAENLAARIRQYPA
jgi:RNA polymerase sigma factor (sigma-70 family)